MVYERIKALADQQRMTIKQIEVACGLSNGSISKWRTSKAAGESLVAVANVLGTTVEELVKKEEE